MTKLDEIEANFTRTDKQTWGILYGELLIRAVRQLGAVEAAASKSALVYGAGGAEIRMAVKDVDPDVLELIEFEEE